MIEDLIMPHDPEAEMRILSAILHTSESDPAYADLFFEKLTADSFFIDSHKKVFNACIQLREKNGPIDFDMLKSQLPDDFGVLLVEIFETPLATHPDFFVNKTREQALRRDMLRVSEDMRQAAIDETKDPYASLGEAERAVSSIGSADTTHNLRGISEIQVESLDRYERLNSGDTSKALPTGFYSMDRITTFRNGKFILIAARPGVGKTAMMLSMARHMCIMGHSVGIFSIEMQADELDDRLMSMETGINAMRLSRGSGPDQGDWPKITEAAARKAKWNLFIDDTGGLPILELCRRARRMKKNGAEIIFIDQFSKIKGDRGRSRFEEKSAIVEYLGDLKKELRIPIVLLAQINRTAESRSEKRPQLSDLKDTGQLEEEADIVLLLDRPEMYDKKPENKGLAWLNIAKHRGGPTGALPLRWAAKTMVFFQEDKN